MSVQNCYFISLVDFKDRYISHFVEDSLIFVGYGYLHMVYSNRKQSKSFARAGLKSSSSPAQTMNLD